MGLFRFCGGCPILSVISGHALKHYEPKSFDLIWCLITLVANQRFFGTVLVLHLTVAVAESAPLVPFSFVCDHSQVSHSVYVVADSRLRKNLVWLERPRVTQVCAANVLQR